MNRLRPIIFTHRVYFFSSTRTTKDMADKLHEGQDVSWKWGAGTVTGQIDEIVEEGQASVTSNKGNTIHRKAREGDPAVKITRKGNDVVKLAHELNEVKEAK
ncbi:hypothetical protein CERSUDRAFT_100646 [Gelatoporia subvermispora B]|uniref:Hypervirulence associated protein TUDOR domain-containing protein n=1 Tax=Ceriporiopsis subvermispora (strain B) TaxID=914234 RepID=M2Q323_CERS8|nr:hypothetical protein CERSUDRAFT_100646 [Gelatoporia subvermispora B]